MLRRLLVLAPLLCFLARVSAQPQPQGPGPEQPAAGTYTLNQNVRAVVLDVVVTDGSGRPVPDLRASDFTVTEDKVPQTINLFEPWSDHALPASATGKQGQALLRASGESPLTVLLIDEISTSPEDLAYARHETAKFLARQPARLGSPTTLVALTGSRLRVLADYTTDRGQLLAAIKADKDPPAWYMLRDRQVGFQTTGMISSFNRLRTSLETLRELARSSAAYHGRKNLLWIGPGLPALNSVQAIDRHARDVIREAILRTSSSLLDARMTVYTIDPQGLLVGTTQLVVPSAAGTIVNATSDPAESELSFEQLAPETGGRIFRMRNDVDAELGEAAGDGTRYYTLAYTPSDRNFNGAYRRIRVTLRQPGLVARTRDGYDAVPPEPPTGSSIERQLSFALVSSLHYEAIVVTTRLDRTPPAASSPASAPAADGRKGKGAADPSATLRASVDTADLHFQPDPNHPGRLYSNVTFVAAALDRDGKVLGYRIQNMHATESSAANGNLKAEFLLPVDLPSRAASLRLIVRDDTTGHLGSEDLSLR